MVPNRSTFIWYLVTQVVRFFSPNLLPACSSLPPLPLSLSLSLYSFPSLFLSAPQASTHHSFHLPTAPTPMRPLINDVKPWGHSNSCKTHCEICILPTRCASRKPLELQLKMLDKGELRKRGVAVMTGLAALTPTKRFDTATSSAGHKTAQGLTHVGRLFQIDGVVWTTVAVDMSDATGPLAP